MRLGDIITTSLAILLPAGLAVAEIDLVKGRQHWAYQPLKPAAVPAVVDHTWPRGDIDRFLLAQMDAAGLRPVRDAEPSTLLRRATYDLTGLPPTPREVEGFLADVAARGRVPAFDALVERLLASPAYGERWGRHWLDLVRYADTSGSSSDHPVPEAQRYRDYVIVAFNEDKPFDRFVREQVAGDLLEHAGEGERRECTIATGYLAGARRFGVSGKEMHLTIEDTINNLGEAFLATSIGCARCHDHMHDPVPASDYYALYGIFQSTRYPFPGAENQKSPIDFVPLSGDAEELSALCGELEDIDREIDALKRLLRSPDGKRSDVSDQLAELAKREREIKGEIARYDDLAYAVADREHASDAEILEVGGPGSRGPKVRRGFLQVLGGQKLADGYEGSGRRQLARWLTSEDNALFARVAVNRIWAWHFGRGIVESTNDFGSHGSAPSHPELLDHLARCFVADGYSIKAMHRRIMRSRAYGLASDSLEANAQGDPGAVSRWRFERRRLSAEEIRDAMLAASGQLRDGPAPPHPFPPKDEWGYTQHAPFYADYDHDHRSIYLMQQRIRRHPVLSVFDGADTNASTPQRDETSGPVGSLFLMNARFAHRCAAVLAIRMVAGQREDTARIDYAHRLLFGRGAHEEDIKLAQRYLADCRATLAETMDDPLEIEAATLSSYARILFCSNEFVYID